MVALASAFLASHAQAFSIQISPIPIVIRDRATSALVDVTNESTEPIRVQATAFEWSQTAAGEDKLDPTNQILVFPSIFRVEPKSTRKVRVGTQGGYGPAEKSFRVIFGEIPENASPAVPNAETVKVVANMSIPVFVVPPGAAGAPKIEGLSVTRDKARFAIKNGGTAHVLVQKVRLEFQGAEGKPTSSKEVAGWYVLPGQARSFEIPLGKDVSCANAKSLVVTASLRNAGATTVRLEDPACAK